MDVTPPCFACQGTAGSEPQGTGLLYIAGEKMGHSGTLGHPNAVYMGHNDPFFIAIIC